MLHQSYFPIVVTTNNLDPEHIVKEAMNEISPGYVGLHDYVVVPLDEAMIVSFKPKQHYEVRITDF